MAEKKFAVSTQHYLFNVQAFAQYVLSQGGDEYTYGYYDGKTQDVIDDVASGRSELGVLMHTGSNAAALKEAFDKSGVEFVEITQSAPRVAIPKSHPLVNASSLRVEDLQDYPYIYFEQGDGAADYLAEEAFVEASHARKIACSDRASLSEMAAALNGYTITSGILVGVTDGSLLTTVPLETTETLHLGYIKPKGAELGPRASKYVQKLEKSLERYARFQFELLERLLIALWYGEHHTSCDANIGVPPRLVCKRFSNVRF